MKRAKSVVVSSLGLLLVCVVLAVCLFYATRLEPLPIKYQTEITSLATEFGFEKTLIAAICFAESSFRETIESNKGAIGLMQLMPSTAVWFAAKIGYPLLELNQLKQPQTNLYLGCAYLNYLQSKFTPISTVLAAYNAGEGRVQEWLNNPLHSPDGKTLCHIPYPETAAYIAKIEKSQAEYAKAHYWVV